LPYTVRTTQLENELRALYTAFNARDLDGAHASMALDVDWPNGWDGGRVVGRDDVRAYWLRQCSALPTANRDGPLGAPCTRQLRAPLDARDR